MTSPTSLALKLLRKEGYTAQVVEQWVPVAHIRRDLFGIIDIVAVKEGVFGVLGIQVTSKSNISARLHKASQNKNLLVWYKAGNNFEIWGSYKKDNKIMMEKRELVKKEYLPKTPKLLE